VCCFVAIATDEDSRHSHLLFTLSVYQYRVQTTTSTTSPGNSTGLSAANCLVFTAVLMPACLMILVLCAQVCVYYSRCSISGVMVVVTQEGQAYGQWHGEGMVPSQMVSIADHNHGLRWKSEARGKRGARARNRGHGAIIFCVRAQCRLFHASKRCSGVQG